MICTDLEDSPMAMAAPAATSDKVLRAEPSTAQCDQMDVNALRTGAHAERQVCAKHAESTVQDANHLNDEYKEATIGARAPDVCGNQPGHVVLMESDQAGAQTMRLWDEKDLNIAGTMERIIPEPASFIASGYGGVHTFHADHRLDDDCDDYDVNRCRESGHRGEQSIDAQQEDMPPANTNRVIKDGGVRTMFDVGWRGDSKRRLVDSDREHFRHVVQRVTCDQIVRPPDVATDEHAHVEEYDMSGNRVEQYATAVVNTKEDMPTGKAELTGRLLALAELRARILKLYAASTDDVGQTCEASSVSDCPMSPPPCRCVAESGSTDVTRLLRRRTGATNHSVTEDGRARASDVKASSVVNVNAAQTSGQLRRRPEPPKLPSRSDAAYPDSAAIMKRWSISTSVDESVNSNESATILNEPPAQFMTKIDPTITTLQRALHTLGANGVFTSKVVTLELMMEMSEIVKQQPRDQRGAHWQRLLGYLQGYKLPELPRQWPPDPGDEIRNVRKRGTERSDGNVLGRGEQTVQAKDELTRQDRADSVTKVWQDALAQIRQRQQRFVRRNVRSRDSRSQTTRTKCDSQILRMQEGAGAPNLAAVVPAANRPAAG
jgi:hypothetical protein